MRRANNERAKEEKELEVKRENKKKKGGEEEIVPRKMVVNKFREKLVSKWTLDRI